MAKETNHELLVKLIVKLVVLALFVIVVPFVISWAWNLSIAALFHLPKINWLEALALAIIVKLLI